MTKWNCLGWGGGGDLPTKADDHSTDEVVWVKLACLQINKYQGCIFIFILWRNFWWEVLDFFSVELPSCNDNTESGGGHCCWLFSGDQASRGHTAISPSPLSGSHYCSINCSYRWREIEIALTICKGKIDRKTVISFV